MRSSGLSRRNIIQVGTCPTLCAILLASALTTWRHDRAKGQPAPPNGPQLAEPRSGIAETRATALGKLGIAVPAPADDIVASLASHLGAELITNEARRAERTPNPDSMDLYFQGMSWFNKGRDPADTERARRFFERALALDPDNLDAAVGKAAADVQEAVGYYVDDKAERLASVEANLNRVLSQSPNDARAHYLLCRVFVQSKRGAQGTAECERALALNPNLASAHAQTGLAKVFDGHPEETGSHELEALRVSPYDTEAGFWVAYMAVAKQHLGAYEDALGLYRRSIELNPNYATGRFTMAAVLAELGRLDEARAEVQAGLALNPGFTIRRYRAAAQSDNPVFLKGRERIIEDMRKAGVPEQ
jgi:Tfp pilus assembly protein PilF